MPKNANVISRTFWRKSVYSAIFHSFLSFFAWFLTFPKGVACIVPVCLCACFGVFRGFCCSVVRFLNFWYFWQGSLSILFVGFFLVGVGTFRTH